MIRKPNPRRKKVKIKITSSGMLVSFGYNIRTPAVVELYPNQIAILANTGMEYEIVTPKSVKKVVTPAADAPKETDSIVTPTEADAPKETDSTESSDEVQTVVEEEAKPISIDLSSSDAPQEESISKKKRKYKVKPIPFPDIVNETSSDDVKSTEETSTESSIDNTELSF